MADKNTPRTRAQAHFTASEQRDALVKDQLAKESAAFDARTAKLRALRLAREAEEAEAEQTKKAAHDLAHPPKPKKKPARRVTAG